MTSCYISMLLIGNCSPCPPCSPRPSCSLRMGRKEGSDLHSSLNVKCYLLLCNYESSDFLSLLPGYSYTGMLSLEQSASAARGTKSSKGCKNVPQGGTGTILQGLWHGVLAWGFLNQGIPIPGMPNSL
jgi:hypothetical protein